jgi:uncharacterized RDD family membrane protein YckC
MEPAGIGPAGRDSPESCVSVPRPESESSLHDARPLRRPLPPLGYPLLATYGQRVGGFLIDIGIPGGLLAVVLIAALATRDIAVIVVVYLLSAVVAVVFVLWNSGYQQGRSGQSLGKRALGTRLVTTSTGEPVGFARAVGRQLAHLLDAIPLCLGYVWPLWDEQRQTFADKACSTLVVHADL